MPDLSELTSIEQLLIGAQRRLGKAPTPENAPLRDALREALMVVGRARQQSHAETGIATNRR